MVIHSSIPSQRMRTRLAAVLIALGLAAVACQFTDPAVVVPPAGSGPGGGQFIVQCNAPVKSAAFDPVVYPGQPVAGHVHEFYGNRTISPTSTYASLSGAATSCDEAGDSAGYWHPTWYSGGVRKVAPKSTAYYKSPLSGPVRAFPAGLKMIAGDSHATSPQPTSVVNFGCGNGSGISEVNQPPQCSGGGDLTTHVNFPNCWDGKHLDSADHKSHMAYSNGSSCPSGHPYGVPQLILRIQFTGWQPSPSTLSLSSGAMTTMHADFWQTWVQTRLAKAVAQCINAGKDCSAADVIGL